MPETLERLRCVMHKRSLQNTVGTVGTLEPSLIPNFSTIQFQQKIQIRATQNNNNINEVPTDPIVPTQNDKDRGVVAKSSNPALEPWLELELRIQSYLAQKVRPNSPFTPGNRLNRLSGRRHDAGLAPELARYHQHLQGYVHSDY